MLCSTCLDDKMQGKKEKKKLPVLATSAQTTADTSDVMSKSK